MGLVSGKLEWYSGTVNVLIDHVWVLTGFQLFWGRFGFWGSGDRTNS